MTACVLIIGLKFPPSKFPVNELICSLLPNSVDPFLRTFHAKVPVKVFHGRLLDSISR